MRPGAPAAACRRARIRARWPIILPSCSSSTGGQPLANTPSAKKDAKRSAIRAQRNRSIRSAVKTKITKFRRGVAEGAKGVDQLVGVAISALDRAVSKGVLHRNNAARRKARLMKRLQASGQASEAAIAAAAPPAKGSRSSAPPQPARATRSKAAGKR
jgi:small subunit ribosomal protein S20